jgi:hypothetical protein
MGDPLAGERLGGGEEDRNRAFPGGEGVGLPLTGSRRREISLVPEPVNIGDGLVQVAERGAALGELPGVLARLVTHHDHVPAQVGADRDGLARRCPPGKTVGAGAPGLR